MSLLLAFERRTPLLHLSVKCGFGVRLLILFSYLVIYAGTRLVGVSWVPLAGVSIGTASFLYLSLV